MIANEQQQSLWIQQQAKDQEELKIIRTELLEMVKIMEMHRQNQIKRKEETEAKIAEMKKYYYSEEGMEAEKAKWRQIYYSSLKEKEKVDHEEEEASVKVYESESECKTTPSSSLSEFEATSEGKTAHEEEDEVSSEFSELELESEPPSQFPPAALPPKQPTPLSSPPSLGYESRKENEMKNLGGKVPESESKPKKAPQPPMLSQPPPCPPLSPPHSPSPPPSPVIFQSAGVMRKSALDQEGSNQMLNMATLVWTNPNGEIPVAENHLETGATGRCCVFSQIRKQTEYSQMGDSGSLKRRKHSNLSPIVSKSSKAKETFSSPCEIESLSTHSIPQSANLAPTLTFVTPTLAPPASLFPIILNLDMSMEFSLNQMQHTHNSSSSLSMYSSNSTSEIRKEDPLKLAAEDYLSGILMLYLQKGMVDQALQPFDKMLQHQNRIFNEKSPCQEAFLKALPGDNERFSANSREVKYLKGGYVASNFKKVHAMGAANFISYVIIMNPVGQIGTVYALMFHCLVVKLAEILTRIDKEREKEKLEIPSKGKNVSRSAVIWMGKKPETVGDIISLDRTGKSPEVVGAMHVVSGIYYAYGENNRLHGKEWVQFFVEKGDADKENIDVLTEVEQVDVITTNQSNTEEAKITRLYVRIWVILTIFIHLKGMKVKKNSNKNEMEWLVQWPRFPEAEATWEEFKKMKLRVLDVHLEDKVKVWDAGIDKPQAFEMLLHINFYAFTGGWMHNLPSHSLAGLATEGRVSSENNQES
ncbi:unnamed protein product [Lactuca saligna]|uniref:Uncharacterized protein n=1 Tax=Lactuca saligna TaxID=75948 RepID=A0AA35ZYG6_LACSI|nr:unnamed protein product [Lactuca saligna]